MSGSVILASPLPGKVSDVKVREGTKVTADGVVLVLEAMRMEIEIRAEASGVIKEIKVKPGEAVPTDKVLTIVESDRS